MGRYTKLIEGFVDLHNALTGRNDTREDINREAMLKYKDTELGQLIDEVFRGMYKERCIVKANRKYRRIK